MVDFMLHDIITSQKKEIEKQLTERYIPRDISVGDISGDKLVRVITGPRRAGKSLFALHLLHQIGPFGYVNFDDERLTGVKDYDEILTAVDSVYSEPEFLLLDEVQNLRKWELFVNRLQRRGYHLVITGSNANLLSSELATHLTGRHIPLLLFPFSFREYLRVSGEDRTDVENKAALRKYSDQGGFPEPLIYGINRSEYLGNLVNAVLYKDIVKRFRIRAVQGLGDLARYLFSNIAREYSFRTLAKVTNCKSHHTVEKYLRFLEEAFLFFSLRRFSFKVKEQTSSNKKIYCIDNGLVEASGFRVSPDRGRLYENLVAIELLKLASRNGTEIFFWRSPQQEEVDFVIKKGTAVVQLIQVSLNISDPGTQKREVRALIKASMELRCDDLLLLTEDLEDEKTMEWLGNKRNIHFKPIWKWLVVEK